MLKSDFSKLIGCSLSTDGDCEIDFRVCRTPIVVKQIHNNTIEFAFHPSIEQLQIVSLARSEAEQILKRLERYVPKDDMPDCVAEIRRLIRE